MAHWGITISLWHQLWNEPDQRVILRGLDEVHEAQTGGSARPLRVNKRISQPSADLYSNSKKLNHEARAKAYSDAMKKVYESYPDDHEAAVFYALSLLASEPPGRHNFRQSQAGRCNSRKALRHRTRPPWRGALSHPCLRQAATGGTRPAHRPTATRRSRPPAPHALHMPSHIFARVGLWQDDINSNLASIAASPAKPQPWGWAAKANQFHAMSYFLRLHAKRTRRRCQSPNRGNSRHAQQERRYVRRRLRSSFWRRSST